MAEGLTYYERDGVRLYEGDMREVLAGMESESFTACVTDPPYHLTSALGSKGGFMGKTWDGGGIAFDPETWCAVLRVLKPGGMLLAFGGTRTFHRMACAVEDAGFVLRDVCMWMYGQGFPKSLNISKEVDRLKGAERKKKRIPAKDVNNPKSIRSGHGVDGGDRPFMVEAQRTGYHETDGDEPASAEGHFWNGWGTGLKPSYEPILIAMKPTDGGFADNALKHGVAGINVDGGRIGTEDVPAKVQAIAEAVDSEYPRGREGEPSAERRYADSGATNIAAKPGPRDGSARGRWPSNVLLSHDERCVQVGSTRVRSGNSKSPSDSTGPVYPRKQKVVGKHYAEADGREEVELWACVPGCPVRMLDEQSGVTSERARLITVKSEGTGRAKGHEKPHTTRMHGDTGTASRFFYTAKASTSERNAGLSSVERCLHPTVKPIDLMRYLLTLVTMPSGTKILDPFAGSGSTLVAAKQLGLECVGVELEAESCEVAAARLSRRTAKGIGKRKKLRLRRKRT